MKAFAGICVFVTNLAIALVAGTAERVHYVDCPPSSHCGDNHCAEINTGELVCVCREAASSPCGCLPNQFKDPHASQCRHAAARVELSPHDGCFATSDHSCDNNTCAVKYEGQIVCVCAEDTNCVCPKLHFVHPLDGRCVEANIEAGCFPPSGKVYLESGKTIDMKDLHVGDSVMVMTSDGEISYSDVTMMGYQNKTRSMAYLTLITADDHKITLTPTHMIFSSEKSGKGRNAKFAKHVHKGDQVFIYDKESTSLVPRVVTDIKAQIEIGAYAPITQEGTIIVDGVVTSSYGVYENHDLIHAMLGPWHALYSSRKFLFGQSRYKQDADGFHWMIHYIVKSACSLYWSDTCERVKEYFP